MTTAVAKAASGIAEDPENLPRTATAAVTWFVSEERWRPALAALAGPLLRLMHVPAGSAARMYVSTRAGLPFFAASNAAEVCSSDNATAWPMSWMCTGGGAVALAAAHPDALGLGLPAPPPPSRSDR